MERVNEHDCEFRFGDHGPKYLFRGPRMEWGVIVLKPGQELGRHCHREVEETFYFPAGSPKMVIAGKEYRVAAGDAFRVDPGEPHNIVNDTSSDVIAVFIKTPYDPEDKVAVE